MDSLKKLEEFEKIVKESGIINFLKKNYNPHTTIIITRDSAKVVSDEIGFPIEYE